MKLDHLVHQIQLIDSNLSAQANKAVNQLLTIRNWLIGFYIIEFEQKGEERATYGDRLIESLSNKLKESNVKGLSYTNLTLFRSFYLEFPEILQSLTEESSNETKNILQSVIAELQSAPNLTLQKPSEDFKNQLENISQSLTAELTKPTESIEDEQHYLTQKMIESLSFTHITQLIPISDPLKRTFYTIEAIKGTWSVRELKRQINALLYERSGISKKPELLVSAIESIPEQQRGLVKDVYTFEFLGLPIKDAVEESDLESALLDHLREFILELGHGFCLEARQKRILIGNEYYFIDLVFYHRILKCHILIELKVEEFNHANAGQLNTYLNYYKKEIKEEGDNDPIGILLVTDTNEALVEYATAGMDQNLFVSKYLLQLPSIEKLTTFINQELKSI
jgi:predicted nuclease of restriction endonuclease-like (RecB) superfamily